MENIPSTMVVHKHVDESDTIFFTMAYLLVNNTLGKWLGMIRKWPYQADFEDCRWGYEPVSDLWPDIDADSDSSNGGSGDEVIKGQDNPGDQEQEEVVSFTHIIPRRLMWGDQR